jgi:hypothetical protein
MGLPYPPSPESPVFVNVLGNRRAIPYTSSRMTHLFELSELLLLPR